MVAVLISLGVSLALGAIAYFAYEDDLEDARQTARNFAEDNDIDLGDIFSSGPDTTTPTEANNADTESAATDGDTADSLQPVDPTLQVAENALVQVVPFEPDEEQIVVELEEGTDINAPASNLYDPDTDTTTLSFGATAVLAMAGDQTDISIGFGTLEGAKNGLSPFDVVIHKARLQHV